MESGHAVSRAAGCSLAARGTRARPRPAGRPPRPAAGFRGRVLSAGVNHETFVKQVEIAMANGASGIIAGRSLWEDCINLDSDVAAHRLSTIAVPRLRELEAIVSASHQRPRQAA